jgi:hypothetical protein
MKLRFRTKKVYGTFLSWGRYYETLFRQKKFTARSCPGVDFMKLRFRPIRLLKIFNPLIRDNTSSKTFRQNFIRQLHIQTYKVLSFDGTKISIYLIVKNYPRLFW